MGQGQEHAGASSADDAFIAFMSASQRRLCRVAYLVCGDRPGRRHRPDRAGAGVCPLVAYPAGGRAGRLRPPGGRQRRDRELRRPWRRERAAEKLPDRASPVEDGITLAVVEALAALPARQRAVVVLRYVEDLDIDTTARLLGISTGTVKSQAAKGLAGLRGLLPAPAPPGHDVRHWKG